MTPEDIDKLFVATFGEEPHSPFESGIPHNTTRPHPDMWEQWHNRLLGFRAAMQSEYVKGLERDAKVAGLREAERICESEKLGTNKDDHPSDRAYDHALVDAIKSIRQRADQIERETNVGPAA